MQLPRQVFFYPAVSYPAFKRALTLECGLNSHEDQVQVKQMKTSVFENRPPLDNFRITAHVGNS